VYFLLAWAPISFSVLGLQAITVREGGRDHPALFLCSSPAPSKNNCVCLFSPFSEPQGCVPINALQLHIPFNLFPPSRAQILVATTLLWNLGSKALGRCVGQLPAVCGTVASPVRRPLTRGTSVCSQVRPTSA
jgi:hypothetical protein